MTIMNKEIIIGSVSANDEIRTGYLLMTLRVPRSFSDPQPGQFVMIRIAGLQDPFLSRPLSIFTFSRGRSHCFVRLLYRVAGKGTQILSGLIPGSQVEVSGPLGKGYTVNPARENRVLIAGGIGVAPLSLMAQHLYQSNRRGENPAVVYLGAKTADEVMGLDFLRQYCNSIKVCTDDGSLGEKSLVTRALQKDLKKYDPARTTIYACGPKSMLQSLARMLKGRYFCQVSLEERMACGVGACMGCAVAVRDEKGDKAYRRACADGPVFELKDVIWE
jgi:dihydroorotate dehydrogenase electron transfer subunit